MKIRNQCKQKIQSESGASLAAALLFFIVCAVVGSIIIAAAMSSAGRMSGITSADNQRYALESARSLIEETMLSDGIDPEDDPDSQAVKMIYYNESKIAESVPQQGKYPDSTGEYTVINANAQIPDLATLGLRMANDIYCTATVWENAKRSWPHSGESGSTWQPQAGVCSKSETIDMALQSGSDKNSDKDKNTIRAKFTMDSDFRIHVVLSKKDGDKYVEADKFVLIPSIEMSYESRKRETEEALSTENNDRWIICRISWQSVIDEQSVAGQ